MIIAQPGFLPVRNSKVSAWLAADRSPKTFNGSNVSQWNDLTANGNNATQVVAVDQPLYVLNAVNGLPAMRFDGVTDFFDWVTPSSFGIQNVDYEGINLQLHIKFWLFLNTNLFQKIHQQYHCF